MTQVILRAKPRAQPLVLHGITLSEPVFDKRSLLLSSWHHLAVHLGVATWEGSLFPGAWEARLAASLAMAALLGRAYEMGLEQGYLEGYTDRKNEQEQTPTTER